MAIFTISRAQKKDMDFIISLAKEEGWNPGIYDATAFYNFDPKGFFIGKLNDQKIGSISAVTYNKDFGFLGFYVVIPPYRNQGFGLQLWNFALHHLGNSCIGLDGVIAQQDNYKKSHFQLFHRNIRFEDRGSSFITTLTDLRQIPFEKVLNYDTQVFGVSRKIFLKQWIAMPHSYSLGKMFQEQLLGYGVMRKCVNGFKIGPLFANNLAIASEIYQGLCSKAGSEPVFLDIPEINAEASQLVKSAKMQKVFETARMYNKAPPKQQLEKVFGITTFELG